MANEFELSIFHTQTMVNILRKFFIPEQSHDLAYIVKTIMGVINALHTWIWRVGRTCFICLKRGQRMKECRIKTWSNDIE